MRRTQRFLTATAAMFPAALVACSLIVDTGDLTSRQSDPGPESGVDASTSPGDATSAESGSIPACVPAAPAGKELLALTYGTPDAVPACPSGYRTSPAFVAYAGARAPAAACSPAGCQCQAPSGLLPCALRIHYADDSACSISKGASQTLTTACTGGGGTDYAALVMEPDPTNGGSCTPSGTASTTKAPASFAVEVAACVPDPAVALPPCGAGLVSVPPAVAATLCFRSSTGSCAPPYGAVRVFSATQAVTDTRACGCACEPTVSATCTGGAARAWGSNNCVSGGPTTLAPGCQSIKPYDAFQQMAAPTGTATVSCQATAAASGGVVATESGITLCCAP